MNEMIRFRILLERAGIEYRDNSDFPFFRTVDPCGRWSVVFSDGFTYGSQAGLLEAWNYDRMDDPGGYCTAEQAFTIVTMK